MKLKKNSFRSMDNYLLLRHRISEKVFYLLRRVPLYGTFLIFIKRTGIHSRLKPLFFPEIPEPEIWIPSQKERCSKRFQTFLSTEKEGK